jgi:uncharacterized protein
MAVIMRPHWCGWYNAAMIIDFHTHIFPPEIINTRGRYLASDRLFSELYSSPATKLASAEDLIGVMDEQSIDLAVVQNFAWSDPEICRLTNDYLMEACARYPRRLIGFGMVALDSPESALPEIERCIKGGMRGIGEIRPGRRWLENLDLVRPVVQSIIENHLILLTHASEPLGHSYAGKGDITPQRLYPFISSFPGLKLVCAHWGGGLPFYTLMPEVNKTLDQVYFDTAASPYLYNPTIYQQTASLAAAGKVLFGSDFPLLKPRRLLAEIQAQEIPEDTRKQILSGNACGLLSLP